MIINFLCLSINPILLKIAKINNSDKIFLSIYFFIIIALHLYGLYIVLEGVIYHNYPITIGRTHYITYDSLVFYSKYTVTEKFNPWYNKVLYILTIFLTIIIIDSILIFFKYIYKGIINYRLWIYFCTNFCILMFYSLYCLFLGVCLGCIYDSLDELDTSAYIEQKFKKKESYIYMYTDFIIWMLFLIFSSYLKEVGYYNSIQDFTFNGDIYYSCSSVNSASDPSLLLQYALTTL